MDDNANVLCLGCREQIYYYGGGMWNKEQLEEQHKLYDK